MATATPRPPCADLVGPEEDINASASEVTAAVGYRSSDPEPDAAVRKLAANRC